jgi:hypothetical protein
MHRNLIVSCALMAGAWPATHAGSDSMNCSPTALSCRVPVHASTALDPTTGKLACAVRLDVESVYVPKPSVAGRIQVVWVLVDAEAGDKNAYRWHPTDGIVIKGNNPTTDFDSPGEDNRDKRRFKWVSVNRRPGTHAFDYVLLAQRYDAADAGWKDCEPTDPKIINRN